ncbi:MAG: CDC48 family AAA ATPase [Thaumarchaeota archaeon]|nr:CDC48 family AAA ATPase [Nitrososphaerota archaeon]
MSRQKKTVAIQLKVSEAQQRDVGKGRARLDIDTMNALDLRTGSVIELIGKQVTAAVAWPADQEDRGRNIIRIDGQTRKNAGVSVNEYVTAKKTDAKAAKSVSFAPLGGRLVVDKEFAEFVKNRLKGFPLVEGDDISVTILGTIIQFRVHKVKPKAITRIEQSTRVSILPEPVAEKKLGPRATYEEIGGLREQINRLREIVELPLRHPEVFKRLGIEAPSGILLYGPPGCGKTLLARALASETEANIYAINGPEIMNKYYGETESKLREIFKEAKENSPSIIFIDEIDAIAPKREEVFGDVEKRVVAQLLALMDGLSERGSVIVMGATNRPEGLDPALRRPGRFDREVEIGVPNADGRNEILQIHTRGMPLAKDVDVKMLADELYGYTGADIRALCREAALRALRGFLPDLDIEGESIPPEILEKMTISIQDFRESFKEIVPTALREFYTEKPNVRWSDIGGLEDVKRVLQENAIRALKTPSDFSKMGIKPPRGILLYGPPGCGKTLLARAIASESGGNCITVRGPEVLSKWVGESERAIRDIFRKAKTSVPCIVFFDEVDSLAKSRALGYDDSGVNDRVLSQMLTEIDSIYAVGELFVIGATNRPDLIDFSLLRPGRLDLQVYVPPPEDKARLEILRIVTARMPLDASVSLESIVVATKGYSGADLEAVCRAAAVAALRKGSEKSVVRAGDFEEALRQVKPSISKEVDAWYRSLYEKMASGVYRSGEKGFYG